jgi:hypothetical protein
MSRSRARTHLSGSIADQLGQALADQPLKLIQINKAGCRLVHGLEHLGRCDGPTQPGQRGVRIYDGGEPSD